MIRREEPDTTWIIHQAAHAYVAGQIAMRWAAPLPAPRDDLLIAAFCHDAGWFAAERTLRINEHGQPRTFTETDLEAHIAIWQDSIDAVFVQSRYAALLTSLHCSALYIMRLDFIDDPAPHRKRIAAFLDEQQAWQDALIDDLRHHPRYGLAVEPQALETNLRLLQVWDYLSLLVCMSTVHEQSIEDVPLDDGQRCTIQVAANGVRGMALAPYPLDAPMTVWIEARQVSGGPFASDAALQQALVDVPYKPLAFEFGPL